MTEWMEFNPGDNSTWPNYGSQMGIEVIVWDEPKEMWFTAHFDKTDYGKLGFGYYDCGCFILEYSESIYYHIPTKPS